jgi:hypothetical protein
MLVFACSGTGQGPIFDPFAEALFGPDAPSLYADDGRAAAALRPGQGSDGFTLLATEELLNLSQFYVPVSTVQVNFQPLTDDDIVKLAFLVDWEFKVDSIVDVELPSGDQLSGPGSSDPFGGVREDLIIEVAGCDELRPDAFSIPIIIFETLDHKVELLLDQQIHPGGEGAVVITGEAKAPGRASAIFADLGQIQIERTSGDCSPPVVRGTHLLDAIPRLELTADDVKNCGGDDCELIIFAESTATPATTPPPALIEAPDILLATPAINLPGEAKGDLPDELELLEVIPDRAAPGVVIQIRTSGVARDESDPPPLVLFESFLAQSAGLAETKMEIVSATSDLKNIRVRVPLRFTTEAVSVFYGPEQTRQSNSLGFSLLGLNLFSVEYDAVLSVGQSTGLTVVYGGTPSFPIRIDSQGVTLGRIEEPSETRMFSIPVAFSCSRANTVIERDVVLFDAAGLISAPERVTINCVE